MVFEDAMTQENKGMLTTMYTHVFKVEARFHSADLKLSSEYSKKMPYSSNVWLSPVRGIR